MELQTGGGQAAAQGTTDSPPSAVESASERVSRAVGSPLSVILVIGATGQVGLGLVRRLIDRGEDVAALVRPSTDSTIVAATGAAKLFADEQESIREAAEIVRGDLRNSVSLRSVCEGVDTVVATANTIVPRRGERADFDALARGYEELGRLASAGGVGRLLFVSVPRQFIGRSALDFDARAALARAEKFTAAGTPRSLRALIEGAALAQRYRETVILASPPRVVQRLLFPLLAGFASSNGERSPA